MQEPETQLVLEAPGGLVRVRAECRDGKAERIFVENLPSFADRLGVALEVDGLGTLSVDTAYGGDSFVIVDADALGFALTADEARDIAGLGVKITAAANAALGFSPSGEPGLGPHLVLPFRGGSQPSGRRPACRCGRGDPARQGRPLAHRHGAVGADGGPACEGRDGHRRPADRGVADRLDLRGAHPWRDRGRRAPGDPPRISGRAWITGIHQHMLDPADPWPEGYRLSDTWGVGPLRWTPPS